MSVYKKNEDQIDSLMTADQNKEMFNDIAPYYDGANHILSVGLDHLWRREAVKRLDPKEDHVYLDVGCGTGDISLEILRQNKASRVIGIDTSLGMLGIGWKKIRQVRPRVTGFIPAKAIVCVWNFRTIRLMA